MTDTANYGLGTFALERGEPFAGLVVGNRVVDLRDAFGPDVTALSLLQSWTESNARLRELVAAEPEGDHALAELRPCVPVAARQLFCAGANYRKHVAEMALEHFRRQDPSRSEDELRVMQTKAIEALVADDPFIFAGLPSALSGARDDVVLPGPGVKHDWELELAVVIGLGGRDIAVEDAMRHVAGYTISNDISTRDLLVRPSVPTMSDLLMVKSRRTFFPTGPYIVPREFVPDPNSLRLKLSVNGITMQDDSTGDLIHGVDRLISYASTVAELYAGDILLTGSPAGNAAHHGNRWLKPGDLLEGEITGLGRQSNRCVSADTARESQVPQIHERKQIR